MIQKIRNFFKDEPLPDNAETSLQAAEEPKRHSFHAIDTQIISVVNQKGGCGKTTTVMNLASALAHKGYKVLVIDTDPQAQASLGLGAQAAEGQKSLYGVFRRQTTLEEIICHTAIENLDVVPSHSLLSGAALEIKTDMGRESILNVAIKRALNRCYYHYILIDCSPTLNLITLNSLVAAQYILVPFQTHYFSLQGMKELFRSIETVQDRLNPDLKILGIVATLFDKRNRINHEILKQIHDYFRELVFKTVIRTNVKLCEAPMYQKPVDVYAPTSNGAKDYYALMEEIVLRIHHRSDCLEREHCVAQAY